MCYGLVDLDSSPGEGSDFTPPLEDWLWGTPGHSSSSSVKVKKSYSTPPLPHTSLWLGFYLSTMDNFTRCRQLVSYWTLKLAVCMLNAVTLDVSSREWKEEIWSEGGERRNSFAPLKSPEEKKFNTGDEVHQFKPLLASLCAERNAL
jgi:hypothetical protein